MARLPAAAVQAQSQPRTARKPGRPDSTLLICSTSRWRSGLSDLQNRRTLEFAFACKDRVRGCSKKKKTWTLTPVNNQNVGPCRHVRISLVTQQGHESRESQHEREIPQEIQCTTQKHAKKKIKATHEHMNPCIGGLRGEVSRSLLGEFKLCLVCMLLICFVFFFF